MIDNPSLKMNQLLEQRSQGKISVDELNAECSFWFLECFAEINPKPFPTMPRRYAEYSALSDYEKRDIPKEFWLIPEVKNYVEQKHTIKTWNETKLTQLKEFKEFLPKGDFLSHSRYQDKINDFIELS